MRKNEHKKQRKIQTDATSTKIVMTFGTSCMCLCPCFLESASFELKLLENAWCAAGCLISPALLTSVLPSYCNSYHVLPLLKIQANSWLGRRDGLLRCYCFQEKCEFIH